MAVLRCRNGLCKAVVGLSLSLAVLGLVNLPSTVMAGEPGTQDHASCPTPGDWSCWANPWMRPAPIETTTAGPTPTAEPTPTASPTVSPTPTVSTPSPSLSAPSPTPQKPPPAAGVPLAPLVKPKSQSGSMPRRSSTHAPAHSTPDQPADARTSDAPGNGTVGSDPAAADLSTIKPLPNVGPPAIAAKPGGSPVLSYSWLLVPMLALGGIGVVIFARALGANGFRFPSLRYDGRHRSDRRTEED
jgi:hypothetical protein